jgi:hypothetical protein
MDEHAKACWREQDLDWLRADLADRSKLAETGTPQAKALVSRTLQHGKSDTELAGIHDEAARNTRPGDEQKTCRALWADVEQVLKRSTRGGAPSDQGPDATTYLSGNCHNPPIIDVCTTTGLDRWAERRTCSRFERTSVPTGGRHEQTGLSTQRRCQIVEAVRRGLSQREVARRSGVSTITPALVSSR